MSRIGNRKQVLGARYLTLGQEAPIPRSWNHPLKEVPYSIIFRIERMNHPPHIERLNNSLPILQKIDDHPWENKVTFNPACTLITSPDELASIIKQLPVDDPTKLLLETQHALCFLFYRAQGTKTTVHDYTCSSLGLAILSPDLKLLYRHNSPVIFPDQPYDNLGVEDARITKVGEKYIMLYTAYGKGTPENIIRIAVASSINLVHWEKHGLLNGELNSIHNKNAMLFEKQVDGKYVILHRPMQGENAMAIHWATAKSIFGEWTSQGLLMKPIPNPNFVDTWIGGGAPPLHLSGSSYLILYHIGNRKKDGSREYNLGIAIADFSSKEIIHNRYEPLLRPESPAETAGDAELGVNNVVFVCGAYFYEGDLYFPYAGADSVVLGGRISKEELRSYLA